MLLLVVRAVLGARYSWGGGARFVLGPDEEYDCSEFVCLVMMRCGIASHAMGRQTTTTLAAACDPLPLGQQRPGDLMFCNDYGHVEIVVSMPDATGHSWTVGASGGGSSTHGDDPNACVKPRKPDNNRARWYVKAGDTGCSGGYARLKAGKWEPTAADRAIVKVLEALRELGQSAAAMVPGSMRSWLVAHYPEVSSVLGG